MIYKEQDELDKKELKEYTLERVITEQKEYNKLTEQFVQRMQDILSEVENPDFFDQSVSKSLQQYGENFLDAVNELQVHGETILYVNGEYKKITSYNELGSIIESAVSDLHEFVSTVHSFEDLKNNGIKLIDTYIFDSKNIEKIKNQSLNIQVQSSEEFREKAQEQFSQIDSNVTFTEDFSYDVAEIINQSEAIPDVIIFEQENSGRYLDNTILSQIETQFREVYNEIRGQIKEKLAQGQVVDDKLVKTKERLEEYFHNQPIRVGFSSKTIKGELLKIGGQKEITALYNNYDLVSSLTDDQKELMMLLKDFVYTRNNKPDIKFDEANLQAYELETFAMQENPYELNLSNQDTLNRIEEKTADTRQALAHLFKKIEENDYETVLDLGTGEGRVGIPLAMKGMEVLGIDQVESEIDSIKERIKNEIDKTDKPGFSWFHLKKLIQDDVITEQDLNFDRGKVLQNYQIKHGNFFELEETLIDQPDKKFDMATFTWHTFCETGTIDNQRDVLVQVFNRLEPGGMVYIEIPDRTVGAYKYALNENLKRHPDDPIGVSRDDTCLEPGVACVYNENATPRFFPGRDEIRNLLKSVGYESIDLDTYLITSKDEERKEYLEVKELVVTAKKPDKVVSDSYRYEPDIAQAA